MISVENITQKRGKMMMSSFIRKSWLNVHLIFRSLLQLAILNSPDP